jgi:hypothetical protein
MARLAWDLKGEEQAADFVTKHGTASMEFAFLLAAAEASQFHSRLSM